MYKIIVKTPGVNWRRGREVVQQVIDRIQERVKEEVEGVINEELEREVDRHVGREHHKRRDRGARQGVSVVCSQCGTQRQGAFSRNGHR